MNALLTHYITAEKGDYQQLADLIVPERDAYCARHGFKHIVQQGAYRAPDLYYAIQRLILLRDLFISPDAPELVWVLNIQSILTNHTIPFSTYTDPYPDHDFFVARDSHATNMGSFIVRRTQWAIDWLTAIINDAPQIQHDWHEQIVVIMKENDLRYAPKIKHLPQSTINAYDYVRYPPWNKDTPGNWKPGDLVLSLPGTNLQQRIAAAQDPKIRDAIIR